MEELLYAAVMAQAPARRSAMWRRDAVALLDSSNGWKHVDRSQATGGFSANVTAIRPTLAIVFGTAIAVVFMFARLHISTRQCA